jgi:hypothetical protein
MHRERTVTGSKVRIRKLNDEEFEEHSNVKRKAVELYKEQMETMPTGVVKKGKGVKLRTITWNDSYVSIIYNLLLLGATNEIIASTLGIPKPTLDNWIASKPQLKSLMQKGRIFADSEVAASLFKTAVGFTHPDEVILTNRVKEFDEFGRVIKEYTEPLRVQIQKHYPPNVKAALKWLSIRRPDMWAENKITLNNNTNILQIGSHSLKDFSDEELVVLKKLGLDMSEESAESSLALPYVDMFIDDEEDTYKKLSSHDFRKELREEDD